MKGATRVGVFLLVVALLGCVPWTVSAPVPSPTPAGPVHVGIVTSISGPQARFGQAHLQGYDLALQEINTTGGILGRPLKLLFEDDGSEPSAAAAAVEKLALQEEVPLVIGAYSSSATLLAAGMAERYQIPLVIPTAAADEITRQGYRWVFRVNAPSSVYTKTLFDFMDSLDHPDRLAIVFENTAFGTSVAEAARREARTRGITVVAYQAYRTGSSDFSELLLAVKSAQPQAVLFVSYLEDAVALMQESRRVALNPRLFVAAGAGFSLPDFPRLAGPAAEYTFSVTQWTPDVHWPGAAAFAQQFEARYGHQPQYHSAEAYVALRVAADALRRAGSLERPKVRDALQNTDLMTILGPVRFDAHGQNYPPMLVTQVIDGRFVTVYPPEVAARSPIYPVPPWEQRAAQTRRDGEP